MLIRSTDLLNMEGLIGKLAETSVLGVVLAISLFTNYFLFTIIQQLQEKRIQDARDVTDSILGPINQIDTNSRLLISLFQKLADQNDRNHA